MNTNQTAKVKVLSPPVPDGVDWWNSDSYVIADYYCTPETDDQPARPCRENLAFIRAAHPDCSLVYFDG